MHAGRSALSYSYIVDSLSLRAIVKLAPNIMYCGCGCVYGCGCVGMDVGMGVWVVV